MGILREKGNCAPIHVEDEEEIERVIDYNEFVICAFFCLFIISSIILQLCVR